MMSHPYFYKRRKTEDLDYIQYEFNHFHDFCKMEKPYIIDIKDERSDRIYQQCGFNTMTTPLFYAYRDAWYTDVKRLPDCLELTPLVCSIWFCDDGCVVAKKRLRIKMATHCFTQSENERLAALLKDKVGEHFSLAKDKGGYFIVGSDAAARAFIDYTKFFPLTRKITWSSQHLEQERSRPHLKNRSRYDLSDRAKQILGSLLEGGLSPKEIASVIGWTTPSGTNPSGLSLYLNRFLAEGWLDKTGVQNSYKNPIRYNLTESGVSFAKEVLHP